MQLSFVRALCENGVELNESRSSILTVVETYVISSRFLIGADLVRNVFLFFHLSILYLDCFRIPKLIY